MSDKNIGAHFGGPEDRIVSAKLSKTVYIQGDTVVTARADTMPYGISTKKTRVFSSLRDLDKVHSLLRHMARLGFSQISSAELLGMLREQLILMREPIARDGLFRDWVGKIVSAHIVEHSKEKGSVPTPSILCTVSPVLESIADPSVFLPTSSILGRTTPRYMVLMDMEYLCAQLLHGGYRYTLTESSPTFKLAEASITYEGAKYELASSGSGAVDTAITVNASTGLYLTYSIDEGSTPDTIKITVWFAYRRGRTRTFASTGIDSEYDAAGDIQYYYPLTPETIGDHYGAYLCYVYTTPSYPVYDSSWYFQDITNICAPIEDGVSVEYVSIRRKVDNAGFPSYTYGYLDTLVSTDAPSTLAVYLLANSTVVDLCQLCGVNASVYEWATERQTSGTLRYPPWIRVVSGNKVLLRVGATGYLAYLTLASRDTQAWASPTVFPPPTSPVTTERYDFFYGPHDKYYMKRFTYTEGVPMRTVSVSMGYVFPLYERRYPAYVDVYPEGRSYCYYLPWTIEVSVQEGIPRLLTASRGGYTFTQLGTGAPLMPTMYGQTGLFGIADPVLSAAGCTFDLGYYINQRVYYWLYFSLPCRLMSYKNATNGRATFLRLDPEISVDEDTGLALITTNETAITEEVGMCAPSTNVPSSYDICTEWPNLPALYSMDGSISGSLPIATVGMLAINGPSYKHYIGCIASANVYYLARMYYETPLFAYSSDPAVLAKCIVMQWSGSTVFSLTYQGNLYRDYLLNTLDFDIRRMDYAVYNVSNDVATSIRYESSGQVINSTLSYGLTDCDFWYLWGDDNAWGWGNRPGTPLLYIDAGRAIYGRLPAQYQIHNTSITRELLVSTKAFVLALFNELGNTLGSILEKADTPERTKKLEEAVRTFILDNIHKIRVTKYDAIQDAHTTMLAATNFLVQLKSSF